MSAGSILGTTHEGSPIFALSGALSAVTYGGASFTVPTVGAASAAPLLINKCPTTVGGGPFTTPAYTSKQALTGLLSDGVTMGSSSYHPGGTQILMGDGTVRFVSDSVATDTWLNLSRRADGVPLGEF